ncbi:glycosyl transferase family 9 [Chlorobaculum parvum NCIB 8327]|uniref:Glycosyl transferase family 9 n=1 Tax=Chlorobaculum parvum (strain DSM 263 / NCIMB 8327) TaxID=517417 RepID=B3QQJ5_CHLP8|nr:glycosyltransferase family 9 protein [Chlorobaculum parvum]ACF12198.1 glycosyl transferase family 9 [Chlorobaculum parvum NCIB 8327]
MKRENKLKLRQGFARLLQAVSRRKVGRFDGDVRSIAILLPERYGDCILLTKLFAEIRAALPEATIHLIAFRKVSAVFFESDPNVASIFNVKSGFFTWIRYVMNHRFDVLFNPKDSMSISFLLQSLFLRARLKVAHRHDYHERLYDRLIDKDYYDHVTERHSGLFDILGVTVPGRESIRPYVPPLPVSQSLSDFARSIAGKGYIGLNLSSASRLKYWPKENWAEFVRNYPEERFVVFASAKDHEDKLFLERELDNVLPLPPTATLGEVDLVMQELKLLVSPDTSLVHMAACHDLPVVALYRNRRNDWTRFAPLSTNHEIVVSLSDLVGDIGVDAVQQAFRKVYARLEPTNGSIGSR